MAKHIALRIEHTPAIGVMIPPAIGVTQRNVGCPCTTLLFKFSAYHGCLVGLCHATATSEY
jgi:hypothetical protein